MPYPGNPEGPRYNIPNLPSQICEAPEEEIQKALQKNAESSAQQLHTLPEKIRLRALHLQKSQHESL